MCITITNDMADKSTKSDKCKHITGSYRMYNCSVKKLTIPIAIHAVPVKTQHYLHIAARGKYRFSTFLEYVPLHEVIIATSQIAKFMGPTWGPPGSCRPQMGPMLAPWALLSGMAQIQGRFMIWLMNHHWKLDWSLYMHVVIPLPGANKQPW